MYICVCLTTKQATNCYACMTQVLIETKQSCCVDKMQKKNIYTDNCTRIYIYIIADSL